jgi:hypothetical protein
VVLALVILVSACSSDSHKTEPTPTSHARSDPREFAVVLDDAGLHVPQERRPAASYTLSFTDRRTHRANQRVALALGPNGPPIVLLTVPAGTRRKMVLLANIGAHVVINGVQRQDLFAGLNIEPSKAYPTPAT